MVSKKIKFKKIAIVILMTVLIWVWADLTLDESYPLSSVTLTISNTRENLWVSFSEKTSIQIEDIKLKGPASQVSQVKQKLNDNSLTREFFIDAEQPELTTRGSHKFDVVDFLKKSGWIREMGFTVESCKPEFVDVNVVELVEKDLTVQVFDEGGNLRKPASVTPSIVKMYVPGDWGGDWLTARVNLFREEIEIAKKTTVSKKPYVILSPGQRKESTTPVEITMPPEGEGLSDHTIQNPTLSIATSWNLQREYDIEIINYTDVLRPIAIKATAAAKQTYESQNRAQMTLHIRESDATEPEKIKNREVFYNFPEEFVRSDEIKINQVPVRVEFRLIPRTPTDTSSNGMD